MLGFGRSKQKSHLQIIHFAFKKGISKNHTKEDIFRMTFEKIG